MLSPPVNGNLAAQATKMYEVITIRFKCWTKVCPFRSRYDGRILYKTKKRSELKKLTAKSAVTLARLQFASRTVISFFSNLSSSINFLLGNSHSVVSVQTYCVPRSLLFDAYCKIRVSIVDLSLVLK